MLSQLSLFLDFIDCIYKSVLRVKEPVPWLNISLILLPQMLVFGYKYFKRFAGGISIGL